jgi:hypothetical protein
MFQPTPDPDSPFASFAQPKKSVIEEVKERAAQERQASRVRLQFLGLALVGTVLGASAATGVGIGAGHVPLALAYGLGAALLGIPVGAGLGMVTWGVASFYSRASGMKQTGPGMEEAGNQWSRMTVWLSMWAAAGMVVGAAAGAVLATGPADYAAAEPALGWAMGGACLGLAASAASLPVLLRRARAAAAGPDDAHA